MTMLNSAPQPSLEIGCPLYRIWEKSGTRIRKNGKMGSETRGKGAKGDQEIQGKRKMGSEKPGKSGKKKMGKAGKMGSEKPGKRENGIGNAGKWEKGDQKDGKRWKNWGKQDWKQKKIEKMGSEKSGKRENGIRNVGEGETKDQKHRKSQKNGMRKTLKNGEFPWEVPDQQKKWDQKRAIQKGSEKHGKSRKNRMGEKRKKGNFHGISLICRKSGIEKHREKQNQKCRKMVKNGIRNTGKREKL